MKWASALARDTNGRDAADRAIAVLDEELGLEPDLLLVFITTTLLKEAPAVLARLRERFPQATLIGCSGAGVIGAGREADDLPAVSLTGASLPGVRLEAKLVRRGEVPDFAEPPVVTLLFADPFSFDTEGLLPKLDARFPGAVVAGGLASGGSAPGAHRLFLDERLVTSGAVCVGLAGDLECEALVAQGVRPLGAPGFATAVDGHLLLEVDGRSPIDVLQQLHAEQDAETQERLRHALVVGLGLKTGAVEQRADELLVRNVVGLEPRRRALAVASTLEPFQIVQFLLRDAKAATEELTSRLEALSARPPAGALLFSCTGRGRHLFGVDDHDPGLFAQKYPGVPLGGFFCNGELGPVAGRTWLHGYTSAFLLFRPVTH
jgi:small ligand-binding sensory domain FIST